MLGKCLTAVIKFVMIAWVVFLLVKGLNKMKDMAMTKEEPAPEAPKGPSAEELLAEIRDALKSRA